MPIPTQISDLSATIASNSPAGGDSPTQGDDYLRAHAAFIRQLSDSAAASTAALADGATLANGDALLGVKLNATGAVATTQHQVNEERISVFRFMTPTQIADVIARTTAQDVTTAVQAAITAAASVGGIVYFPSGTYKITSPLVTYGDVSLYGDGANASIIKKTTNTNGSGTAVMRGGTVTDTYVVDSIISVNHSANVYAYRSHIRGLTLQGNNSNTYGLYAPRISHCIFDDVQITNVLTGYLTYDAWLINWSRVTCTAVQTGWRHADDGSAAGTGTSCNWRGCWVNFDNTINVPTLGWDLYGLTYSGLYTCAVDNATTASGSAEVYGYSFNLCSGIDLSGCGMESSRAGYLKAIGSRATITSARTFSMSANAGWGSVGGIYNDGSTLVFAGCNFVAYSPATGVTNQIIQNGAKQTEIECTMPSGGASFTSYSSGSTRTVMNGGQVTVTDSTGPRVSVPQVSTITYSASMTPDYANGQEFVITATNGTAFTINASGTVPGTGAMLTFTIRNTSGGALGAVTWAAAYKLAAWTSPATANSRSITFRWDGTNYVEVSRTTADVPN